MTYPEALKANIKAGLMTYEQAHEWLMIVCPYISPIEARELLK